jgi:hypothetical protein
LDKNSLDLEKLAEKLGRPPLFGRLYSHRRARLERELGERGMESVAIGNPRHGSTPTARPTDDR